MPAAKTKKDGDMVDEEGPVARVRAQAHDLQRQIVIRRVGEREAAHHVGDRQQRGEHERDADEDAEAVVEERVDMLLGGKWQADDVVVDRRRDRRRRHGRKVRRVDRRAHDEALHHVLQREEAAKVVLQVLASERQREIVRDQVGRGHDAVVHADRVVDAARRQVELAKHQHGPRTVVRLGGRRRLEREDVVDRLALAGEHAAKVGREFRRRVEHVVGQTIHVGQRVDVVRGERQLPEEDEVAESIVDLGEPIEQIARARVDEQVDHLVHAHEHVKRRDRHRPVVEENVLHDLLHRIRKARAEHPQAAVRSGRWRAGPRRPSPR